MTNNLTEANETSINNGKNAKSFFCKLNKLVKKYKEFGITICAIVGTLATFYWNLLCEMYYNGYAKGLGIDTRFIEKDSQGLFISILIYLSSSILLLPAIKKIVDQVDKNMNKPGNAFLSFLVSVGLAIIPFVVFVLIIILTQGVFLTELLFLPFAILTLFLVAAIMFLIEGVCSLFLLLVQKIKSLFKKMQHNNQQQNNGDSNIDVADNERHFHNNRLRLLFLASVIVVLLIPSIYGLGWYAASHKNNFEFIVDNFTDVSNATNSCGYNLILSQNSDSYCLSKYAIFEAEGKQVIIIYPDYQTIVPKNDEQSIKIIKKQFDLARVKSA